MKAKDWLGNTDLEKIKDRFDKFNKKCETKIAK
jgi:hypothetical protein